MRAETKTKKPRDDKPDAKKPRRKKVAAAPVERPAAAEPVDKPWAAGPDVDPSLPTALFAAVRAYGHAPLELEFRLGHSVGAAFVPGVPERCWTALKRALDDSVRAGHMTASTVETRECIHDEAGAKYVLPDGYWMFKQRVFNGTVEMRDCPWTCRMSVSTERVDRALAAPTTPSVMERHKHRWSYRCDCWSIDLTRVVSNLTHQRDNDGESHEVEIELVDTAAVMFTVPLDAIVRRGAALAEDMCGLMKDAIVDADR